MTYDLSAVENAHAQLDAATHAALPSSADDIEQLRAVCPLAAEAIECALESIADQQIKGSTPERACEILRAIAHCYVEDLANGVVPRKGQ